MSSTTTTAATGNPPHILIFPYPAQGHALALLDLTHQLSLHHLTLTILTTPKNLPTLSPLLSVHPAIQTLVLPFPSHPSLPPGVENVKDIGNHGNLPIISALTQLSQPIAQWFNAHPNPPVAIISDFFLGWTQRLAQQLNIPRIAFFSLGAFAASVVEYCFRNVATIPYSGVVDLSGLPKTPSFKQEHLPSIFRRYRESGPDAESLKCSWIGNVDSWGCVFNSLEALEGEYLDNLKTKMGHGRIFMVGPLSLLGPKSADLVDTDSKGLSHVMAWLDSCPDGSVLYVCFGSQKLMKRVQMQALALGLEQSRTRFIWVVKTGTTQQMEDGYGMVPDGFEERVAGRGVVVRGWAPQVEILNHRSVGGFLSHCGWNSLQEGIVAGVVILAWPMEADQFVNAKQFVEDLGVAVRVCEGADTVPDSTELGKVIAESMKDGRKEKGSAKELKDKALAAVRPGGSSIRDLDELVKQLYQLQVA